MPATSIATAPVFRTLLALCLFALLIAAPAKAEPLAGPLVSANWVKANLGRAGLVLIDLRQTDSYNRGHIPGAVNSPGMQGWPLKLLPNSNTVSAEESFGVRLSRLGISKTDHVVLIATGLNTFEIAVAAQVYWIFKFMGHDGVSIMNGGMNAYLGQQPAPIEKDAVSRQPTLYRTTPNRKLLATTDDVRAAANAGVALVDYRESAQHLGVNKDVSISKHGTIPCALNAPTSWMTINGGGTVRAPEKLLQIYQLRKIPFDRPRISFGNVSVLGALGWFLSHEVLGNKNARLYFTGFAEWTKTDLPVERKLNFD